MRVLIVRVGAMGDVVHALPAVAALRLAQPEWEIDWTVDPRWAPLLVDDEGRGPLVAEAQLAQTKLWSAKPLSRATLGSVLELRGELRKAKYDLVVDMQGTLRSSVIGRMAGAKKFVGYSDPRESAAAMLYRRKVRRSGVHVVEQGANLLGAACGLALEPAEVPLPRTGWAEQWAEHEAVRQRPMCVLAAGGGWKAKQWPIAKYGALARELSAKGYDVVVNAPRADDDLAARVLGAAAGAARSVVCNVAGLIALLRRTDLLIGGDSGPMHVAAALAVPVIALFGPTSPERNGPWGPGAKIVLRDASAVTSYKRGDTIDPSLEKISVEQVLRAVEELR